MAATPTTLATTAAAVAATTPAWAAAVWGRQRSSARSTPPPVAAWARKAVPATPRSTGRSTPRRLVLTSCSSSRMAVHRSQCFEVLVDLAPVAGREPVADVGAELGDRLPAGVGRRELQVGLQVGLAQALPGSVGEGGDGVGGQAQQRADLGRRAPFHLGVPEHHLPALGQRGEGGGHHPGVLAVGRDVEQGQVDVLGHLAGDVDPPVLAGLVVPGVADAGHEVRPEGDLRSRPPLQGRQDPGEGLRDQVVDVGAGGAQAAGGGPGRAGVTAVQHGERGVGTGARAGDQLGVTEGAEISTDPVHLVHDV